MRSPRLLPHLLRALELLLWGALVLLCLLPAPAAPACPLQSEGLLWTGKTAAYTIFLRNETGVKLLVDKVRVRVQVRPDAGQVPDPANERTVLVSIPQTAVPPHGLAAITFKAPLIDPRATVASGAECAR